MSDYSEFRTWTVERYDVSSCGDMNCEPLLASHDGAYVAHEDYETLMKEAVQLNLDYLKACADFDAMSAQRDQLKAEVERLRTAEGDAMTYKAGMENVAQQRDQLKAEVERIERNRDMWKAQVERQAEELTALRKDAERYRFLRSDLTMGGDVDFCIVRKHWKAPALESILSLTNADEQIDAAMTK